MHGYVCAYPNKGCSICGRGGNPIEQPRGGSGIGVGEGFGGAVFGDVALQDAPLVRGEGGGALDSVGFAGDGVPGKRGAAWKGGEGFYGEAGVRVLGIGAGEIFFVIGAAVAVGIVGLGEDRDALASLGESLATEG